jgi:hypothetical protein
VYRQRIEMFTAGDSTLEFYVLMHELGHALGVYGGQGHSSAEWSIMYRTVSDVGLMSESGDRDPQWVRPVDALSVRAAWGLR